MSPSQRNYVIPDVESDVDSLALDELVAVYPLGETNLRILAFSVRTILDKVSGIAETQLSDAVRALLAQGVQFWVEDLSVAANRIVIDDNKLWLSTAADDGTGDSPSAGNSNFRLLSTGIETQYAATNSSDDDDWGSTYTSGTHHYLRFIIDGTTLPAIFIGRPDDGNDGEHGISDRYVFIRSATEPDTPTGTYTEADGLDLDGDWEESPPDSDDPLYASVATINRNEESVTFSSVFRVEGYIGIDGIDGKQGRFYVNLYQNAENPPATPTTITYTFETEALANLGDWSVTRTSPGAGEGTYAIEAIVDPDTEDASVTLSFNTPVNITTAEAVPQQREESVTFQAFTTDVEYGVDADPLLTLATDPVSVGFPGSNADAEMLSVGTAGNAAITVRQKGTYLAIWEGEISVTNERATTYLHIYNNDDTVGTDAPLNRLKGAYHRVDTGDVTDDQSLFAVGRLTIEADDTVIKCVPVAELPNIGTTLPAYTINVGSTFTLVRLGGTEGRDGEDGKSSQLVFARSEGEPSPPTGSYTEADGLSLDGEWQTEPPIVLGGDVETADSFNLHADHDRAAGIARRDGVSYIGNNALDTNEDDNGIYVYDDQNAYSTLYATHANNDDPTGVAITPDGTKLFVCDGDGEEVFRYNPSTGAYVSRFSLPSGLYASDIDADNDYIYILNSSVKRVDVFEHDGTAQTAMNREIPHPGVHAYRGLKYHDGRDYVLNSTGSTHQIRVYKNGQHLASETQTLSSSNTTGQGLEIDGTQFLVPDQV